MLYYQELRIAGVKGVLAHMAGGADQWIGELRGYIYAKLMWNPDYDIDAGVARRDINFPVLWAQTLPIAITLGKDGVADPDA